MKKLTFFLSLLLAFVGLTASAQTFNAKAFKSLGTAITSVDNIVDGGYYAFLSVGKNKYIKIENPNGDKHFANDASLTEEDCSDALAVFKIKKVDGGYQFETALEGYYMGEPVDGATNASNTPATFVIKAENSAGTAQSATDQFCIGSTSGGNRSWFDMQVDQFCGWDGAGSNSWYKIVPVTVSDDVKTFRTITYTYLNAEGTEDATISNTSSALAFDGYEVSAPTINPSVCSAWYSLNCTNASNIVSETNTQFTFQLTEGTAPFDFSTTENRSWYLMRFENSESYYLNHENASDENLRIESPLTSFETIYLNQDNYSWSFEKSGYGVKAYNKEAGKYLTIATGENQEKLTLSDEGSVLIVRNNITNGGYSLQLAGNANACFGHHTGVYAGVWNNGNSYNASQSRCDFFPIEEKANNILVSQIESLETASNILGAIDESTKKNLLSIAKSSASLRDKYFSAYQQYKSIPEGSIIPDANAYYRIKSVAVNTHYISTKDVQVDNSTNNLVTDNANATRSVNNDNYATSLWKLIANDDNSAYYFYNINLNAYLGKLSSDQQEGIAMQADKADAGEYSMNRRTATKFALINNEHRLNAYGGKDFNKLGSWDGDGLDGAGNNWIFEIVNDIQIPVTISDAKYASVAYPFATQVTGDVKAYYASAAENGALTLTEYPEGIIPANEGAILFNEGGETTATLNVISTDKTIEGNLLKPATAKRAGFTAGETYVLAKNTAGEAAFLKSELTVVPANKAYIAATDLPTNSISQDALGFNFGGDVTGINAAVATDKAQTEYYDLQGRRVLYPVHGIFVTNTGKKVLVK